MNTVERAEFLREFDKEYCNDVMEAKGDEYSRGSGGGDDDVNANFKLVAKLLDGAPMDKTTVAAVYFLKHVASVCKYVATREEGTEGIYSRIGDARNYLGIMASLIEESRDYDGRPEKSPDLTPDAGRFAHGPLTEVAASTHSFDDVVPHLKTPQAAGVFAAERVIRSRKA